MVPLALAHRSGGWTWSEDKKREYANDLSYEGHLIAVKASANRAKGSKGPEDWKPPERGVIGAEYEIDWPCGGARTPGSRLDPHPMFSESDAAALRADGGRLGAVSSRSDGWWSLNRRQPESLAERVVNGLLGSS